MTRVVERIVAGARRHGFHRVGVAPIDAPTRYRAYRRWLAAGYGGTMTYLSAPHQLEARRDLRTLLAGARTAVVVGLAHADRGGAPDDDRPRGIIARYARGEDYHAVMRAKLGAMAAELSAELGRPLAARPCIDSAPVLERDAAVAAGIGFVAKNTMLIAPGLGSYLLLGELLLDIDVELEPDEAGERSSLRASSQRCGDCRACLDACPTGAFVDAHVLDARRCISYLTIEHRGEIPRALRPAMSTMIFGCDVCQEVCPFNAAAPARTTPDPALTPRSHDAGAPDLIELMALGANQYRRWVAGTALRRAPRKQLRRNLCVALGNAGDPRAIEPLTGALSDRDELVRGHAAWALGRLRAEAPLRAALADESSAYVRREIEQALSDCQAPRQPGAPARAEPARRSGRR